MSVFNHNAKEIHCKIVYYGPSLGGKTTNIQWVYNNILADQKSKLISLDANPERTIFFDFLPINRQISCEFLVNSSYICCPDTGRDRRLPLLPWNVSGMVR